MDPTTYRAGYHHRNHHQEKEKSDQCVVDDLLGGQTWGYCEYGPESKIILTCHQTFVSSRHQSRSRWRCAGIIRSCETEDAGQTRAGCFLQGEILVREAARAHLVQYLLSLRMYQVWDGSDSGITTEALMMGANT